MLKINKLTLKNFMSFGNVEQEIVIDTKTLTLILGENRDITNVSQSADNRNGCGKCFCINTTVKVKNTKTGEICEISVGELYDKAKKQSKGKV